MTNYAFDITDSSTIYTSLIAGDTFTFGAGLDFDTFAFLQDGDDLMIYTNNGATLRLTDHFLGAPLVYNLNFSTGETIPLNTTNMIFGTTHDAALTGTSANDTIYAGIYRNTINAGAGDDTIYAGFNNDTISDGDGNDTIYAGWGVDHIISSAGSDYINGGGDHDYIDYRGATNGITANIMDGTITDGTDTDTIVSIEEVIGTNFDDLLVGNNDYNSFSGEGGNDNIQGRGGDDWLSGGAGNDTMRGGDGNDTMYGGNGSDQLFGGDGDDLLHGGGGLDALFGQAGADTFQFDSSALSNSDNIKDFSLSDGDKIDISMLLHAYDPLNDLITDFVQITDNGTHSYVAVDGSGGANFQQVMQVSGVIGLTDEALLESNGTLITA